MDQDGSGCVSLLEAEEVIFGKWLLGWNFTDISEKCHPRGDRLCEDHYNSKLNTANYNRNASSPWYVLVAASLRASGERMFTDCRFMVMHFGKPDWDECLQQKDIMEFLVEALNEVGKEAVWSLFPLLVDPKGNRCLTIAEQQLGRFLDFLLDKLDANANDASDGHFQHTAVFSTAGSLFCCISLCFGGSLSMAWSGLASDPLRIRSPDHPSPSVSVYAVDSSVLGGCSDPSVESCSEGAFQSFDSVHIMSIGIVEHWFIKPSDIAPYPSSILGNGSFGIVVKGMLHSATEVAIKIPKTRFQSVEASQLANEMRLFRHIRHSNIVLFHGATLMIINGGSPSLSLVLEWVNGGNFGEYMQQLRSNGEFEAGGRAFAYKILLDVARGMTYLHSLTPIILHLDLKPANILVEKSVPPKGKITDFGLSRFARNRLPQHKVGTEKYMAPEVAQRKPYGPAADVFSFGRVIIWTVTGKLCPELISSSSFEGNEDFQIPVEEDSFLFQTLGEVASSCLQEEPDMRPNFVQVFNRLSQLPQEL
ncbi:unnamed protein product [Polarella glacialis]|uniref:Protein kinase domain-containing protein n=1 Tax=Polarella glacialis TaxID=89957 RepID=A0A813JBT1_POLGL|nr:unnamed protein product [Polarella glacialis]